MPRRSNLDVITLKNSIFAIALKSVSEKKIKAVSVKKKELDNLNKKITDFIKREEVDKALGEAVAILANKIKANTIVSVETVGASKDEEEAKIKLKVTIFKKQGLSFNRKEFEIEEEPSVILGTKPIKTIIAEAIKRGFITNEDSIIALDDGLGTGILGNLSVFYVKNLFADTKIYKLDEQVKADVIDSVINIALEIGREGREGKHVGTGFIIGDPEELKSYTKQMILNPFSGYPDKVLRITDPELKETVKNFAQLDGVFVISKDGLLISAGTYLSVNTDIPEVKRLKGFGTRHRCAAAITKHTNSIAVVVSESGGKVRVFKKGKILLTLM